MFFRKYLFREEFQHVCDIGYFFEETTDVLSGEDHLIVLSFLLFSFSMTFSFPFDLIHLTQFRFRFYLIFEISSDCRDEWLGSDVLGYPCLFDSDCQNKFGEQSECDVSVGRCVYIGNMEWV